MTQIPVGWSQRVSFTQRAAVAGETHTAVWLRIVASALRVGFIACLLAITVRVSMPQSETIWTVYDTPGDLVRLILGVAACLWIAAQFFRAPKDAHGHRTWLYFGVPAIPFALVCIYAVWR